MRIQSLQKMCGLTSGSENGRFIMLLNSRRGKYAGNELRTQVETNCYYPFVQNFMHTNGGGRVGTFKGTVRWFNNVKGYGFVSREGGEDVFVHYSSIVSNGYRTLVEGEDVEYDIVEGNHGPQAEHVKRIYRPER